MQRTHLMFNQKQLNTKDWVTKAFAKINNKNSFIEDDSDDCNQGKNRDLTKVGRENTEDMQAMVDIVDRNKLLLKVLQGILMEIR